MATETVIEDPRWAELGLAPLAEAAVTATLRHLGLDPQAWDVAVLGCDDARIATLNAEFRGKPTPTNVLSWPSDDRAAAPGQRPAPPDPTDPELGDIAIAWQTTQTEAAHGDIPLGDHTTHLIVHAALHLLGYDHIDDHDGDLMEMTETAILARLGVPDPYGSGPADEGRKAR